MRSNSMLVCSVELETEEFGGDHGRGGISLDGSSMLLLFLLFNT
jgi:hypothetical protein